MQNERARHSIAPLFNAKTAKGAKARRNTIPGRLRAFASSASLRYRVRSLPADQAVMFEYALWRRSPMRGCIILVLAILVSAVQARGENIVLVAGGGEGIENVPATKAKLFSPFG